MQQLMPHPENRLLIVMPERPNGSTCRNSHRRRQAGLMSSRLDGGRAVDDAQPTPFERIVVADGAAGRAIARRTGHRAGFEAAGIFAIESGIGDAEALPDRLIDELRLRQSVD